MRVKIEVGVLDEGGSTVWPTEFRTWAEVGDVQLAMAYVLALARWEKIAGFRTSKEQS
jgi:hypothetical protein